MIDIRDGRSTENSETEWSVTTMLKIAIFQNVAELAKIATMSQFRNDITIALVLLISVMYFHKMGFKFRVLERAKCMQGNM